MAVERSEGCCTPAWQDLMRHFPLSVSAALVLVACGSEPNGPEPSPTPDLAHTAVTYIPVDLGTLGGTGSEAFAINPAGQVVGRSTTAGNAAQHAFLWQDGVMRDLGPAVGGVRSEALDINEGGQVVGTFTRADGRTRGFLWHNGSVTRIGGGGTQVFGINRRGQVVGTIRKANGETHPFLWENGVMTDLAQPVGTQTFQSAYAINNPTHIVGGTINRPVRWIRGNARLLHAPNGGAAFAINNVGYIVGYVWTLGDEPREHAALWREGVLTDLGTLGGQYSTAWGVSELGVVVGQAERADGTSRGFVWENGTMSELPTLGGNFGRAMGINRAGNVVGTSGTVSRDPRATLWLRR